MGRLDGVRILIEPWLPLRGFSTNEAVEIIKAVTGGPTIEGAHRGGGINRCVVPFAERGGVVAVVPQHLGDSC